MSDEDRIAKLEKENAELRARVEALEPKPKSEFKAEPWKRYDPTEGMSMDRSTMAALAAAVPDNLVRSIVADNMRATPVAKPAEQRVIPSDKGWRDQVPLGPYEGQKHIDAMIDVQDALDKRDLAKRLGQKP